MTTEEKARILRAIEKQNGYLSAELVVRAASNPSHPLHGQFTWDDKKAAHAHRLNEARVLIHGVTVNMIVERRQIRTIAYVRDPLADPRDQGYKTIASVMRSREETRLMLVNEFERIESNIRRVILLANAAAPEIANDLSGLITLLESIRIKNERRRKVA